MDRINTITVNGTTYEIGGTSDSDRNSYIIPKAVSTLNTGATHEEIKAVFDTETDFDEFIKLIKESSTDFYIEENKTILPVSVQYANLGIFTTVYLRFIEHATTVTSTRQVVISFNLSTSDYISAFSNTKNNLVLDNKINVTVYNLTESSTDVDIKSALSESWSFANAVNFGIKMIMKESNNYYNIDLPLYVIGTSNEHTLNISCNLPGCFGKEKGGIISIRYSSGTYSIDNILAF